MFGTADRFEKPSTPFGAPGPGSYDMTPSVDPLVGDSLRQSRISQRLETDWQFRKEDSKSLFQALPPHALVKRVSRLEEVLSNNRTPLKPQRIPSQGSEEKVERAGRQSWLEGVITSHDRFCFGMSACQSNVGPGSYAIEELPSARKSHNWHAMNSVNRVLKIQNMWRHHPSE
eukprot:GEMP01036887.1.p1 GENE.GEMP01036887.1~~GEMP01036887.1.p1  ORF type:complete len:173 (+),score=35.52 GEMP01036887.1:183-701(+)